MLAAEPRGTIAARTNARNTESNNVISTNLSLDFNNGLLRSPVFKCKQRDASGAFQLERSRDHLLLYYLVPAIHICHTGVLHCTSDAYLLNLGLL
jgi:hypothetical protein